MTDTPSAQPDAPAEGDRIVIRDKRKINPSTGTSPEAATSSEEAPTPEPAAQADQAPETTPQESPAQAAPSGSTAQAAPAPASAEVGELKSVLDERTADLQRVTAEYANYRKRVERDRTLAAETAVGMVLAALLPVLDDIDRARDHGDLNGPFASVAEQLSTVVGKFGLTPFGVKGDAFDPKLHEAVAHMTSADVTESTCIDVMRRGYLMGERLLRPAMVAVADPADPSQSPAQEAAAPTAAAESTTDSPTEEKPPTQPPSESSSESGQE